MIDFHCHILPQMDDGSQSPGETMAMLEQIAAQGVTTVFATSHFYADRESPADFLARREKAVAQLRSSDRPLPEIVLGAEVAYFSGISICKEITPLQLGDTKLILIEMPFRHWSDRMVKEICDIPQNLGLIPVLAHINRYRDKRQFLKYRDALHKAGVLFQCNCDVFTEWSKRRWVMQRFKEGNIHFFGSDCHNLENCAPNLPLAAQYITKKRGADAWESFNKTARSLIQR